MLVVLMQTLAVSPSKASDNSNEEACFKQLNVAAKKNPAFNDLDLSRVSKINGKNQNLESDPFSIETYADFQNILTKEIPFFSEDIIYFPNAMNNVSSTQKFIPRSYKSNRNNSAFVLYSSGNKTKINHWVSKTGVSIEADIRAWLSGNKSTAEMDDEYYRQSIDGYYLDSNYVTFGRESDLAFSFPTRAANPATDSYFPTGRPVRDMREYMVYTQHLAPQYGGDLLSCEIIKVVPQPPYKLKDYDANNKSIKWENYGSVNTPASSITTEIVGPNNDFRKAEIDFSVTTKNDGRKKLLRYYVISINYNNNNQFLNTFRTVEMFNRSMRAEKNAADRGWSVRSDFYDKIEASGLGIAK